MYVCIYIYICISKMAINCDSCANRFGNTVAQSM